jgi:hypothetical protein
MYSGAATPCSQIIKGVGRNDKDDFMMGHMICWVLDVKTDKFLQPKMPEEVGGR